MARDANLDRFRQEYERLHRAFKLSHENEKKLLRKVKDLNADIVKNAAHVQTALKLTQDDSQTMMSLKEDLARSQSLISNLRDREEKNKTKIEHLHAEIKQLRQLIDQGNSISSGQNNTVNELVAQKDTLQREKEQLFMNLTTTKNELTQCLEKIKGLNDEKLDFQNSINQLNIKLAELEEKKTKEADRQKKFQDEMENMKRKLDSALNDNTKKESELEKIGKEKEVLNDKKHQLERERDENLKEIKTYSQQLADQIANNQALRHRNGELTVFSHELESKINVLRGEVKDLVSKLNKQVIEIDKLKMERDFVKNQKAEVEKEKEIALNTITSLERVINDTRRLATEDRKVVEQLNNARTLLNRELGKAEENNKQQAELSMKAEKLLIEKDNEISNLVKEIERKNKKIAQLEKDKEKYGINAAQANAKYFHSLEEIKLKDNLISEFQKKNIETEAKLKQQQNLYEAVRSDRNLYSKNLTETQDEIAEIKRRYKIVSHQISQLKEEIDAKEAALTKEHFDLKQAEKKTEELEKQYTKITAENKIKEDRIKSFINENSKLQSIIKESEAQRKKLKEEYESVIGERDILGTQLIRKNDELALLYEKIKIQQSTLAKGEAQYRERLNDIDHLRNKIRELYRSNQVLRKEAKSIPELKSEIHNLKKELIDEKLKVRGLSDELENPMNVHRWRKLEGTDSDTYEMITKIQTLQKRLIAKTEEVKL